MLLSIRSLYGYALEATDGNVGRVEQAFFDDQMWTVRYLVVKTGGWLSGRKVLISPIAVQSVNFESAIIGVSLTRKQIENSPDIDTEKPVSRQMETQYHEYYRWPLYWNGGGVWGMAPYPSGIVGVPYVVPYQDVRPERLRSDIEKSLGDPHLRSSVAVRGYRIEATDAHFGHVEDFIVDDRTWTLRYLVIDTKNFWPGKSVLISPDWVNSISWEQRLFQVALSKERIKSSPEFRPDAPVNREYEERLYDYYGRPKYWADEQSSDRSGEFRKQG